MNNSEFFDLVMSQVSRTNDPISRAFAVAQLRVVLQNLDNSPFHPWFLVKNDVLQLQSGLNLLPLPEDFLDFLEDSTVRITNSEGEEGKLSRYYFEDIQEEYANSSLGSPIVYDIVGNDFLVGPSPDSTYTIRLWYYKKTNTFLDDSTPVSNLWVLNAEDLVTQLVAERVARLKLRNKELADGLRDGAETLRMELFRLNESRKHTDMNYAVNK